MEIEKKLALTVFAAVIGVLLSCSSILATPIVDSLIISPPNPWLGQSVSIKVNCTGDENASIAEVTVNVTGDNIIFSEVDMPLLYNNTYGFELSGDDLSETGSYDVAVLCTNNLSVSSTIAGSFTISTLGGEVTGVSDVLHPLEDGIIYEEELFDAYVVLKKDGNPVKTGVTFSAELNNANKDIQEPIPYVENKGYRLRMQASSYNGNYILELSATYQNENVIVETPVEIRNPMELELLSIDRNSISTVEPITIKLRAKDHGNPVNIGEHDLVIKINSIEADINEITQDDDSYFIEITPPSLLPGTYSLVIQFSHGAYTRSVQETISYDIALLGEISYNGKGFIVEIRFKDSNGIITTFTTDSSGIYSGTIPPGDYDVILYHPESKLTLNDVDVNEFDDPLRFYYDKDKDIPGIITAGLYVYETALSFSDAYLEMKYNSKKVPGPESELNVYKCDEWNGNTCYSDWEEIDSDIDTVRNTAAVTVDSLSAFVVGIREGIKATVGTDKEEYNLYEKVKVSGIITGDENKLIEDAEVTAWISGTTQSKTATTNFEGVFVMEFDVPSSEGTYTVEIEVENPPFEPVSVTRDFNVVKSRGLSISMDGGIKMDAGTKKTVEVVVKNTGQLALNNIEVAIIGLPDTVVAIIDKQTIEKINSLEEVPVSIEFSSLHNSSSTHTLSMSIDSDEDVSAEKTFVLTTEKKNPDTTTTLTAEATQNSSMEFLPDFSMVGGVIAEVGSSSGYILAVLAGSLSFAFIMRKKRISKMTERGWVKNLLSSVNREVNRNDINKASKHKFKENKKIARNKKQTKKKEKDMGVW